MRVGSEKKGRAINCGALKSVWDHGFIVCVFIRMKGGVTENKVNLGQIDACECMWMQENKNSDSLG